MTTTKNRRNSSILIWLTNKKMRISRVEGITILVCSPSRILFVSFYIRTPPLTLGARSRETNHVVRHFYWLISVAPIPNRFSHTPQKHGSTPQVYTYIHVKRASCATAAHTSTNYVPNESRNDLYIVTNTNLLNARASLVPSEMVASRLRWDSCVFFFYYLWKTYMYYDATTRFNS